MVIIATYKFRIKDSSCKKHLKKLASQVDLVWNYCNETSYKAVKRDGRWLSGYDLQHLTSGVSRELNLTSKSVQYICAEYALRRKQFKKRRLNWRTQKRNLGWIPLNYAYQISGDTLVYNKRHYRFWLHRPIIGEIKTATLTEDSRGRWYLCVQAAIETEQPITNGSDIGIDLGLKTLVTCSDDRKFSRTNITKHYEKRLAMAQRAHKKRQVKTIHTKIANSRRDWNHKVSHEILQGSHTVIIGDVSSSKLLRTKLAKSVADASWSQLRSMFVYKAIRLGVDLRIVNEAYSTCTCSQCLKRTGPKGKAGLSVREWTCPCGARHDRDINAARNILRMGLHPPVGSSKVTTEVVDLRE